MPNSSIQLLQGDCLHRMAEIDPGSVDMVLADLPYGTTQNAWDSIIPLDQLWAAFKRICKPGAPVVLFSQQPFTTVVAASNLKQLRTEWIWSKPQGTGFLNANRYPLKAHENILVFCERMPRYAPQKSFGHSVYTTGKNRGSTNYGKFAYVETTRLDGSRFPTTVLSYARDGGRHHPTAKPVALLEYLIRTYTEPGMTVLDCTMGSGSTGVAAVNTGRRFVGIELDAIYFIIAERRVTEAQSIECPPEPSAHADVPAALL